MVPRRALMTFHHILSSKKIASLQGWSRELDLIGIIKTGYPGVLLVAGQEVDEYVRRVKRLRWQTCALRVAEDMNDAGAKNEIQPFEAALLSRSSSREAKQGTFKGLLELDSMKDITEVLRETDQLYHPQQTRTGNKDGSAGEWEQFYSSSMTCP